MIPPPRKKIEMKRTSKVCARCGVEKPLTNEHWHFKNRNQHGQGYQSYCKPCRSEISHEWLCNQPHGTLIDKPQERKVCTWCGESKPLTHEYWTSSGHGWSSHCSVCSKERINSYRQDTRIKVLEHYGNGSPHCSCCGDTNPVFLAIDHIGGGGAEHRKKVVAGRELAAWLIRNGFPEGFRILCHNCNYAFHHLGYCPHNPPKTSS